MRPEWWVLASLAQLRRATAKDIGAHCSMHKTKVSRAVFQLESRKWLQRQVDQSDRRVEHLILTKAGNEIHAKLAKKAIEYQQQLLVKLGRRRPLYPFCQRRKTNAQISSNLPSWLPTR